MPAPKSPPLYPAADPNVIAVTATDADDKLFEQSNRGRHIAIAAPGAQILVAIPDGGYEVSSGTSYSAAEVSGIVALMLERKRDLTPDKVRGILLATAKDLGPKGRDIMFGAGWPTPMARSWRKPAPAMAADAAAGRAREHRRALNDIRLATCGRDKNRHLWLVDITFPGDDMTATNQPQMMPLRVTRNDKIADGIHLLEFRDAGGKPLPQFSAGAHIAIRVPNGLLRKYSLCNDPAERDRYQVAVKREANGRGGSTNLIDGVKAGDELMVAPPVNDFGLPQRAQDFLFIAGGIGITPIMAMIRQVQAAGQTLPAVLLHALAGDDRVHRRAERARIQGQGHHPLRPRRSGPVARSQAGAGRAKKPRASVLLRAAPADGSGARHDRPLVVDRGAFRGVQRSRDAQGDRQAVQGEAGALRRGDRGAGRPRPSSKSCASTASRCRVRARPAPAAPAAPSCWPAKPTTATWCSPSTSAPTPS